MSLFDIMDKQLTAMQNRWPDSFQYESESFACSVISLSSTELKAYAEAFGETYSVAIQVQKSLFENSVPKEEEACFYAGKEHRINKIFTSSNGLALRLVLGGKYG